MSKSNVNPNHYKVAGRERQGEDIPQARNKRKHAESLVRRRTKVGEGPPPSAREGGAASPGRARARTAKTAARKARATPLQTPPRSQARAQPGSWTLRAPRAVSEGRAACRARANRCRAKGERQAGNEAAERQTAGRGQARQAVHRTEAGSPSARVRSHAGHERHRPLRKKAVATLAPNRNVTRSGPRWMRFAETSPPHRRAVPGASEAGVAGHIWRRWSARYMRNQGSAPARNYVAESTRAEKIEGPWRNSRGRLNAR